MQITLFLVVGMKSLEVRFACYNAYEQEREFGDKNSKKSQLDFFYDAAN